MKVSYEGSHGRRSYTFAENTALEGLGIGGGVRYVGKRYGDAANTFEKNGYRASLMV